MENSPALQYCRLCGTVVQCDDSKNAVAKGLEFVRHPEFDHIAEPVHADDSSAVDSSIKSLRDAK